MEINKFAKKIDYTLLRPEASKEQLEEFCKIACKYNFKTVAILPNIVKFVKERLKGTGVGITVAISFPTGVDTIEQKIIECKEAIEDGADEFDMVVNVVNVILNKYEEIESEVKAFRKITEGVTSKLIFEAPMISDKQIKKLCEICVENKIDYVKTSTGFNGNIAKIENIKIMKRNIEGSTKLKAAGGIRNLKDALVMIDAGAERLGISCAPDIVEEYASYIETKSTNKEFLAL